MQEGEEDPHPALRLKGNLYLLAHGTQAARLLTAIRDQYCGDPLIGGSLDVAPGLLESMEAAAALLAKREPGVSCLAVVTNGPRLSLVGSGDCRAFLEERRKGSPQALLVPRYPHKKLGMETSGVIERAQRSLGPGDRMFLCCGPLAQALGLNELLPLLSSQAETSPQRLADQLAGQAEASGGGAVLVIACHERSPDPVAQSLHSAPKAYDVRTSGPSTAGRRRGKLPLSWLLAVFVVITVGSAAMDSLGKYVSLPQVSWPWDSPMTQKVVDKDLWDRVEALWLKGQKGDVEAWREAVALLERLQSAQPGDPAITEKLQAAQLNRLYAEAMGEVAVLWGMGETSPQRVESWAKAVQVLEGLEAKMVGTGFLKSVVEKLYAARVNYGKALEAAGRLAEARATYEKARSLDLSRPEALDALRRLR